MKKLNIRKARKEEMNLIPDLLRTTFKEYQEIYTPKAFQATICNPEVIRTRMAEGSVLVAAYQKEIVGTASFFLKEHSLYIRGMGVHPKYRGRKIAWKLLEHIEQMGKEKACTRLVLSTTPFLEKAIRLYEKFGFTRSDEGPIELHGTPLFTMVKLLQFHQ